jgi:hypothetical protein
MLITAYRQRVPVVSYSPALVKAGAALGLYASPTQAGRQVVAMLKGAGSASSGGSAWPASRLAVMTLDEYTQAGSKDSFTYWIESRLDELGSIWGGSSFKFGVFSRKNLEARESAENRSYSDTHGWYSSLGATAEEAFDKVRGYIGRERIRACRARPLCAAG